MNFSEIFLSALQNLQKNKIRTFLTMLGIIVSINSAIIIHVIGESLSSSVSESFNRNYGTNIIAVEAHNENRSDGQRILIPDSMRFSDEMITDYEKKLDYLVEGIYEIDGGTGKIQTAPDHYANVSLIGVNEPMEEFSDCEMISGRFITAQDCELMKNTAVISDVAAKACYGTDNVVGEYLYLRNSEGIYTQYVISGVYRYIGRLYDTDEENMSLINSSMYVSYSCLLNEFPDLSSSGDSQKFIVHDLKKLDYIKSYSEDYFNSRVTENGWTYKVVLFTDEISHVQDIIKLMTALITIISVLALIIGGFGIMNIMLVTINERTREIGIKLAIGASKNVIIMEFLVEAVLISFISAFTGVVSGLFVSFNIVNIVKIVCNINHITSVMPVFVLPVKILLLAFLFSMITGVVFGIIPAIKASRKNVVDALRTF